LHDGGVLQRQLLVRLCGVLTDLLARLSLGSGLRGDQTRADHLRRVLADGGGAEQTNTKQGGGRGVGQTQNKKKTIQIKRKESASDTE
jgi:hypothetical protein